MKSTVRALQAILLSAAALSAIQSQPQARTTNQQPLFELRPEYLTNAGLPLPSSMPDARDVMLYQAKLSAHQELTIEWDLIPGTDKPVLKETVKEGSLSGNFVLLDRKQHVAGSARTSTLTLREMTLVTAAVGDSDEVLGLAVGPGSPMAPRGEQLSANQNLGHDFVYPKRRFTIYLPDDPKIVRLIFLLAHPDRDRYRLERVGSLALPSGRSVR